MKKQITARSRHDEYSDEGIKCTLEEKVTKESFKDLCDVNKIIERIARTGEYPEMSSKQYMDVSNIPDYASALSIVLQAQAQFNSLDASVRNRFNNNPAEFLKFASDAKNLDSMVDMGLATKTQIKASESTPEAKQEISNASS